MTALILRNRCQTFRASSFGRPANDRGPAHPVAPANDTGETA